MSLLDAFEPAKAECCPWCGRVLLTPRERDVLRLLCQGYTSARIGQELLITQATAKFHLHSLYQKLRVTGAVECIAEAYRQGLVQHE